MTNRRLWFEHLFLRLLGLHPGRDLHEIDLRLFRKTHRLRNGDDSELVAFDADQANLRGVDLPVDAYRLVIVSDAKNPLSDQSIGEDSSTGF